MFSFSIIPMKEKKNGEMRKVKNRHVRWGLEPMTGSDPNDSGLGVVYVVALFPWTKTSTED